MSILSHSTVEQEYIGTADTTHFWGYAVWRSQSAHIGRFIQHISKIIAPRDCQDCYDDEDNDFDI